MAVVVFVNGKPQYEAKLSMAEIRAIENEDNGMAVMSYAYYLRNYAKKGGVANA